MFNSREYEWSDLTLILGGKDITGIRAVKYTEHQEKEYLYGKGNLPSSIQKGNLSYDGEIVITQSELESLRAVAKNNSILNLQLDAVVNYGNPTDGDVMITDVLQGIQFTESPHGLKQGDKSMEITLPIIFLRLKKSI